MRTEGVRTGDDRTSGGRANGEQRGRESGRSGRALGADERVGGERGGRVPKEMGTRSLSRPHLVCPSAWWNNLHRIIAFRVTTLSAVC